METNKKGISLIVLVITIIVLAILAATVIIAIVNTGVINSAKDAVEAQKLGQVRDIATVAWGEALIDPNVSTPGEYLNHIIGFLKGEGYTDEELDKYTIVANVNGVTVNLKDTDVDNPDVTPDEPEVNPDTPEVDPDEPEVDPDTPEVDPDEPEVNPDVPGDTEYAGLTITKDTEGVTFTKADGVTPGDPDNLEVGDIVIYGDYEYCYNSAWSSLDEEWDVWGDNNIYGWGVRLKEDCFEKTSVGELCGSIYGEPLVFAKYAFSNFSNLVTPPQIPSSVVSMYATFEDCSSLVTAPVIPSSVTDMSYTFASCINLKETPAIPVSVTNMSHTFHKCTSLTEAPDMSRATSVTDMSYTFASCTNLTEAPIIPSGVTDMSYTFESCGALTGQIQINSSKVSSISFCFKYVYKPLTVKVPVGSTTYDTITSKYGSSSKITIETFEPEA